MGKEIAIIVIFVILIGVIIFVYFKYEKPSQEVIAPEKMNISLATFLDGDYVKTGYSIYSNGFLYVNGTTNSNSYKFEQVPSNSSILIVNYNLNNQTFYINSKDLGVLMENVTRVRLDLELPGNITISQNGRFLLEKDISIVIKSQGKLKNPKLCLKWSISVIFVDAVNYSEIDDEDYDKCFILNSIENSEIPISFTYSWFGNPDRYDYIKFYLLEKDDDYLLINQPYRVKEEYTFK